MFKYLKVLKSSKGGMVAIHPTSKEVGFLTTRIVIMNKRGRKSESNSFWNSFNPPNFKLFLPIALAIGLLFFVHLVSAIQPTQQYNKIYLNPFYRDTMSLNTNYSYTLPVNPPDGISTVANAIINFNVQINGQTQTFTLWANNKSCNNPTYSVATSFSSTGNVQFYFDCSNVINSTGNYNIILKSAVNTGTIQGWLDLTYMNRPSGEVLVHGTEYQANQKGKLWLQLLDANKASVDNGVCYLDIYTPSNAQFVERATMIHLEDGVYYYDLMTPYALGVYPAVAKCYYVASQNPRLAQSYIISNGKLGGGTLSNTYTLDSTYLDLVTDKNGGLTVNNRLNATFNFSDYHSQCGNVSQQLLTGITYHWTGIWNSGTNNNMYFYTFNYTSSKWVTLPNNVAGGGGGVQVLSNSITTNNASASLGTSSVNPMLLKIENANINEGAKHFQTDYMYVSCDQLSSPSYQQVQGSSEMHISPNPNLDSGANYIVFPSESMTVASTVSYPNLTSSYYTGIFVSNFTMASTVSATVINDTILAKPFHTLPCNSFLGLYRVGTNGTYTSIDFRPYWSDNNEYCYIEWKQTLDQNTNYNYIALARNIWGSDASSTNAGANTVYPLISAGCDLWAIQTNETPYPYVIPKNDTIPSNSYFYRSCADYYDNFYWFNQTYQKSLDRTGIIDDDTFAQYEADYYSLKFAQEKLITISGILIDDLLSASAYSQVILSDPLNRSNMLGQRFWSNQSTQQFIYYLSNSMSQAILSQNNYGNYSLYQLINKLNNITVSGGNVSVVGNVTVGNAVTLTDATAQRLTNALTNQTTDTFIGGTEYYVGDSGKVTVRLLRGTADFATLESSANCYNTILYPNETMFVNNQSMTNLGNGVYYYPFIAPDTLGIYTYYTDCYKDTWSYFGLNTFSVSQQSTMTFIGGTEYAYGANGKIAVRITQGTNANAPVLGATCIASVLYPNQTTFVGNASMTEQGTGNYYYNFIAPSITGIYIYYTNCNKGGTYYYGMETFHVTDVANSINLTGVYAYLNSTQQSLIQVLLQQTKQTQFSQEQVYLITDAVTEMQGITEKVNNGDISPQEAEQKIQQIQQTLIANKAFAPQTEPTPNEIYLDAVKHLCVASITNEGKVTGEYDVTMQIEGENKEVQHLTLGAGKSTQIAISMANLQSGNYYCSAVSNYPSGTSKARIKIYYDPANDESKVIGDGITPTFEDFIVFGIIGIITVIVIIAIFGRKTK